MEWRHSHSPQKKKFKATASAGKVMVTVFWDCEGVILIDVMPRGSTLNSEAYVNTLTKLKKRFQQLRRHNNPAEGVEVVEGRVSVCRDFAKGQCRRSACKYYHIPVALPPAPVMAAIAAYLQQQHQSAPQQSQQQTQ
nr:unnamed protein product [Callosobruchus analis]